MQNLAPIALFVYNRPEHTRRTLQFLKQNDLAADSRLFIFSDGPKNAKQAEKVAEVRALIKQLDGFKSVEIIERKSNLGLANSVINGVNQLMANFGKAIVFEDDLITSPYTLRYFNDALARYEKEEQVMHIGAYMYPLPLAEAENLPETFFFRAATSWGWATWARAWQHFNPDVKQLMQQFTAEQKHQFSIEGSMNFWKQMRELKAGKNNSWAIRWYASIFLKGGLTLNPAHSLVSNIGHDGSGVHSGINEIYNVSIHPKPISVFPTDLVENQSAYIQIKAFLKHRKGSFWQRLIRYINQRLRA
ncbi:MAG: sugar transferase [Sphingobacteriaceae bacterium]